MTKTILEIYALAVCFFAVACFVITLGIAAWNVIELSAPKFTISNHQYKCHQTDAAYKGCFSSQHKYTRKKDTVLFPTGEELTRKRKSEYESILKFEQRLALQGIVQKFIIIFIDVLVFFIHWRLARHSRENHS